MQRDTPLRVMPTPTAAPVLVGAVAPSPCCHMQRHPMGTANLNSSSQPLSNPWPLSRVWQGDSDTYRHVTRATRVPPPTRTGRQLLPTRSSAPAAAPAGREAGKQGLSPAIATLGWGLVPCLLCAMGASSHAQLCPPHQGGTHSSGRGGRRRDAQDLAVALGGENEQDGLQPRVETRPLPAVRPRIRSRLPGLQPMPPNRTVAVGVVWNVSG